MLKRFRKTATSSITSIPEDFDDWSFEKQIQFAEDLLNGMSPNPEVRKSVSETKGD